MDNFVRTAIVTGLNKWASDNSQAAKKLGEYVKSMAKMRINNSKQKKLVLNKNYKNILTADAMPKWSGKATCADLLHELFVVEGDSAGGSIAQALNKLFQECYKLKGVPKNSLGLSFTKILENEEFKDLSTLISDGKGNKIKPEECPYDKIIISTDADKYLMSA